MSVTEDKKMILEGLWKASCPLRPKELSEKLKFHFPALMMHLVGLKRLGYVNCPEKGYYAITEKGKEVLGFSSLTQQLAKGLRSSVPSEKAFYFFNGIGNYLGICASGLEDFCEKSEELMSNPWSFTSTEETLKTGLTDLATMNWQQE